MTDGEVRGFFISSALCSGIWMSASSKHHSCQVLIIVNEFHLLHRFPFPPADSRQRAGPTMSAVFMTKIVICRNILKSLVCEVPLLLGFTGLIFLPDLGGGGNE